MLRKKRESVVDLGKKRKTIRITICPICGSTNIRKASPFSGWLLPEEYVCLDCGYRGPVVAEIEVDEDEVKEDGSSR
ncbi:MAG: hypothetical protein J7L91_03720 [Candidatus Korarchaeota archaeon]|nr:hypothetical protein [Candidatus Korarchaeota archaeon]